MITFNGNIRISYHTLYFILFIIFFAADALRLYNFYSSSTQLSIEFQFFMKDIMLKNKEFSCFGRLRYCIYPSNKCLNANNHWHFICSDCVTFYNQLSVALKSFINSRSDVIEF